MNEIKELQTVLIAAVTPTFLERGGLWFAENEEKILRAAKSQAWWGDHILVLEKDREMKLSRLARRLTDLGYQKTHAIVSPGEFSQLGDTLRIAAINYETIVRIEFLGNKIERIEREAFRVEPQPLKPKDKRHQFREGDYVVHLDHGIGIYKGEIRNPKSEARNKSEAQNSENLEFGDLNLELYHVVEYAPPRKGGAPDRLLVPLDQEKKLSLYIGFDRPTIHRLGGTVWFTTKRKLRESAENFARELLKIYAAREGVTRPPFYGDPTIEQAFADAFPFVETLSQSRAIDEILRDLEKPTPMDRVLVGDVGFGKTEVAMRAALRVVLSGKQVALLAPTTILADQHERTFKERFKDLPITINSLSRLTPKNEAKHIVEKVNQGAVDIFIGTHRILSKDIVLLKLGMLIIDEEQKFGVLHKEHFKKLRSEIDILSISATPIPRTLSLTMANLRSISEVNDPPPERVAVKNFVLPYRDSIVKEAIEAELKRKGQVYLLHNRVETIGSAARLLQALIPQVSIGVIHGRMDEPALIKTLAEFRNKKIDILVATTIIENGLDFSNVNTLVVENATRLGLAQSYQIRGRIGRSDRAAYAYFLYPAQHLTPEARERLETLESFEALGSGYQIALRDLEMRGAGAILGKDQSGAIQKGGLNLYCQLLAEALEVLKS
ncbi:MAG: DEAD/DEAH box helicase [Candidatus Sungbacteria bacterium]|uniref:DEAD/DEAH box helicase n=1 Tax=Candidatus Sungiibacteriota bacterium TaxID=2750080 RepID=A0A9D6LQ82_9BACT|nr:DEAD/DEAH box helicase [Candidatus Sungbacteria bacterium]